MKVWWICCENRELNCCRLFSRLSFECELRAVLGLQAARLREALRRVKQASSFKFERCLDNDSKS